MDPILRSGATPVFADVDPLRWMLDPEAVRAKVGPRTRAVVAVHLFGAPFPVHALRELFEGGVALIEDCAQALGARLGAEPVGTLGDVAAFSFFPTKNLGGYGDGGAVVTRTPELAERVRRLRVHGRGARPYVSEEVGYNARLDTLQAALLNVKLPSLDRANEERRRLAGGYARAFADARLPVRAPDPATEPGHVFHQYVIEVPEEARDALRDWLGSHQVGSAIYYPVPLHRQPSLGDHASPPGSFPVAEAASRSTLALPIFPGLTDDEQAFVVDRIAAFFASRGEA